MININAFSKEHPNGARNRSCIKSPELLKRIDKALAAKEIPAKELDALEQTIRCTNQCFVPQWLLTDLYDTTGVSVKVTEKPAPKAAPIKEPVKTPVVDNNDNNGTGEPGLGIEDPTLNPGVGHPADEGTGEPAPEPIEPVGEGIPDGEPMNTNGEIVDNGDGEPALPIWNLPTRRLPNQPVNQLLPIWNLLTRRPPANQLLPIWNLPTRRPLPRPSNQRPREVERKQTPPSKPLACLYIRIPSVVVKIPVGFFIYNYDTGNYYTT